MVLADLPDHARLHLVPCDPPLAAADAEALVAQADKLFTQFAREGRLGAWAIEAQVDGAVLAMAWVGDADLSGCSRDKVARLLLTHEECTGRRLLGAPPILVATTAGARCVDRRGLRELIASGAVEGVYDLRAATLGAWRSAGRVPLAQSPFAALAGGTTAS